MRKPRLSLLVAALGGLLWITGSASAQTPGNDTDTTMIQTIWQRYAACVEKGDGAAWLTQYDAEGIQMRPDAPARTKPELDAQVPAAFKARVEANEVKMTINPAEIVVAGSWAYSRGAYVQDFTAKATGQTTHIDGKFLTIFKKQADGSWKIFRDCFNSNVPPK
jgi:ketosteroid isomerase-like protein